MESGWENTRTKMLPSPSPLFWHSETARSNRNKLVRSDTSIFMISLLLQQGIVDNTRDDILESTSQCVVNVLTIFNYSPLNIEQSQLRGRELMLNKKRRELNIGNDPKGQQQKRQQYLNNL